ncbi:hypothetical protein [Treponema putidum]|uniref:Lipoprotein n=1 Tax=Treponema putidum TaxID=221027 RepID=A0AAE9MRV6_9SPIR|nr:hypothetical protein [Treponema putidum]UTY32859.1 hypothetical protein E4N74_01680 [Treponema putidum]
MFKKNILFTVIAFIFLSCGIDDVVYLEPPKLIHSPTSHSDENEKYFEFRTSDTANLTGSAGYFKGFEVYYRIYESKNDCENAIKSMEQYAETNPSNSVNYLISAYNYKLLSHSNHYYQNRPIVNAASSDRSVKFRIEKLNSSNDFSIDGSVKGRVLRQFGEEFTDEKQGDYDVQSSSNLSSNPPSDSFYVAAFAATYGFDSTFKTVYSKLISLGYVEIKKNS